MTTPWGLKDSKGLRRGLTKAPTRAEKKALKKSKILDAAWTVFGRNGYTGTSLDAIAEEAGVSKPTLYIYFGSKEGLFEAVLADTSEDILGPWGLFRDSLNSVGIEQLVKCQPFSLIRPLRGHLLPRGEGI